MAKSQEKYRPAYETTAKAYTARHRRNLAALAEMLGVTPPCVEKWVKTHAAFRQAVADGEAEYQRNHPDAEHNRQVEEALLKSALGYEYMETRVVTEGQRVKSKTVTNVVVAPNPGACERWLKHRWSERWPFRSDVNVTGEVKGPPTIIIRKMYAGGQTKIETIKPYDSEPGPTTE